jgi:ferredoxin
MRVAVDHDRCQGHGQCFRVAPDLFDLDEQTGLSHVLADPVPPDRQAAAQTAKISCPERAISIQP